MISNDRVIENEQTVLGCLLIHNDCFDDISLKTQEFFVGAHRIIYSVINEYLSAGKPIDLILLAEHLEKQGSLDGAGGLKYIGELVQNSSSVRTVKSHAKKISDAYKRRNIQALLVQLSTMVNEREEIEKIMSAAETGLFDIVEDKDQETFAHISKFVADAVDWEEEPQKGVHTGLRDLDRLLGGLKPSDLIVLAGRPSSGKSTLGMQIAEHVALTGNVVVFSLEMSGRQLGYRMFKYHENRVGKSEAISHLYNNLGMHIEERSSVSLGHIISKCREIKRKKGLDLLVIDYLQLITATGENRTQQIGMISRGLKSIAKEFSIPVIALSQLSRKVEDRADKRPIMSDIRESGDIEQDSDVILFIYRDEYYNQNSDDKGLAEIICRKNRNGSTGDVVTKFDGSLTRFSDFNGERILRSVPTKNKYFD